MSVTEVIYFRTDREVRKALEQRASDEHRSVSNLCHVAMREWLGLDRPDPDNILVDTKATYDAGACDGN